MNEVYSTSALDTLSKYSKDQAQGGGCLSQNSKYWYKFANFNYKKVEHLEVQNYRVLIGRPLEGAMSAILEVSKGLPERSVSKVVVDKQNYKYLQEHFFYDENRKVSLLDQLLKQGVDIIPIQEILNYIALNYNNINKFFETYNKLDQEINPELPYAFAPLDKLFESVIKLMIPAYAYDHDTHERLKSVAVTDLGFLSPLKLTKNIALQDGFPRGMLVYDTASNNSKRQERASYFMDGQLAARYIVDCTQTLLAPKNTVTNGNQDFYLDYFLCHKNQTVGDSKLEGPGYLRIDFDQMFLVSSEKSARKLSEIALITLTELYFEDLQCMYKSGAGRKLDIHPVKKPITPGDQPQSSHLYFTLATNYHHFAEKIPSPSLCDFNATCVPYDGKTEGCYLDALALMHLKALRKKVNEWFVAYLIDLSRAVGIDRMLEVQRDRYGIIYDPGVNRSVCFDSDPPCKVLRLSDQVTFMSMDDRKFEMFAMYAFLNASKDMRGQYAVPTHLDLYMSGKDSNQFPCMAALNLSHFEVISFKDFEKNRVLYHGITASDAMSCCTLPPKQTVQHNDLVGYEPFMSGVSLGVVEGMMEGGCSYFDAAFLVRNPVSRGAMGWYTAGGPVGACLGVASWAVRALPYCLPGADRPGSFMRGCAIIADSLCMALPLLMPGGLYRYAGGLLGFGLGNIGMKALLSTFYPISEQKAAGKLEDRRTRKSHRRDCTQRDRRDRIIETTSLWRTLTGWKLSSGTRAASNMEEQNIPIVESDLAQLNRLLADKKTKKASERSDAEAIIVRLLEKMDKEEIHPMESLPKGVISDLVSWLPGSSATILDKAITTHLDNLTDNDSKARFIANQVKRYENYISYINGDPVSGRVNLSNEKLKKAIHQLPGLYLHYLRHSDSSVQSCAADLWQALDSDSNKDLLRQTALILMKNHIAIHNKPATQEILDSKKIKYDLRLKLIEKLTSKEQEKLMEWGLSKTLVNAYLEKVLSSPKKQTTDTHRLQAIKEWDNKFSIKPALTDNLIHLLNQFELTDNHLPKERELVMRFHDKLRVQAIRERGKKGQPIQKCLRAEAILSLLRNKLSDEK